MDMLDAETIAQRQYEAQLAFNERQKKRKECAAKKAEIDAQLKPLEIQLNLLKADIEVMEGGKTPEAGRAVQTRSDVLTRRLLELQEEGRRMMAEQADLATPAAFSPYSSSRSRGHGSYRGRSSYRARGYRVPRGRGYSAVRGGRYRGGGIRSSVRRLDNRPKSVLIGGFKAGSTQDEALRQHLFVRVLVRYCNEFDTDTAERVKTTTMTALSPILGSKMLRSLGSKNGIKRSW